MAFLFGRRAVHLLSICAYASRRRPGWRWKEGWRWHRVPGKLFDSNPILYLTDVHSSAFRLAWCLLESTRSARLAFETESHAPLSA